MFLWMLFRLYMPVAIQGKILKYLYTFHCDFPWRHKISPYRIMIAEFMLQRTRAEQVEPVYKQFIKRYPSVILLSKAKKKRNYTIYKTSRHALACKTFYYCCKVCCKKV